MQLFTEASVANRKTNYKVLQPTPRCKLLCCENILFRKTTQGPIDNNLEAIKLSFYYSKQGKKLKGSRAVPHVQRK